MAKAEKTVSLGDDGLIYTVPKPPPEHEIAGYELSPKKQKFQREKFLTDDEFKKVGRDAQLEILTRELIRRSEGYWFFNNGVPTYITGSHYFYLNYWYIAAMTEDGMPEYRSAQRKWAYFVDLCEKDNLCFGGIMLSGKRFSKALSIYTDIPTPKGWKQMLDIHVGDFVFGSDGKPTKVISESEIMFNNKCFEITFSDGETVIADAGHRWVASSASARLYFGDTKGNTHVKNKKKQLTTKIVTTQEMYDNFYGKNGYPNWAIENSKPIEYKKRSLKIPPYILGLWLGDGSSNYTKLTTVDDFILNKWTEYSHTIGCEIVQDKHDTITYMLTSGRRGGYSKRINKNKLLEHLKEYSLINNKHIPQDYLYSSVEDRIELMRGLMDTDGHKSKNANTFHLSTKHKHLQEQFYELVVGLGMKAYRRQEYNKKYKKYYYSVVFGSYQINPFQLPRKKDLVRKKLGKGIRHHLRYVHKIIEVNSVPVKCIAVNNEDHTYLCTKNYIPTHNTEFALAHIYNLATLIENDCLFGLQSLNWNEAKNNLFKGRILRSHRRIPDYLKPTSNDSRGKKEITSELTFIGEKDGSKHRGGLSNVIDHRPTLASAYQGKRPREVYIDESGSVEEMDIVEALSTIKQQLQIGKRAFGKIFLPATLESMTPKGAPLFFQIWNESNPSVRDANGRTQSWLYRYFNPQYEGREDFIDDYGNSKVEEAKTFRKNEIDFATASGQMKIKRQYPETTDEAFGASQGGLCWEDDVIEILQQQKKAIIEADVPLQRYNIISLNKEVSAHPSKNGHVWMLEPPKPNCIYIHTCDGVASDMQAAGEEGSNIAGCIIKIFDPNSEPYMPVLLYSERPKTIEGAYHNLLNQGIFYNKFGGFEKFYAEANASHASHYGNFLINRGYKEWIAMRKDLSGKGWTDQKKMFQYRTPELLDFLIKQGNMFFRKYAHSVQMLPLIESLLLPASKNADLRDAFLQLFTARPNFDEQPKKPKPPRKRTVLTVENIGGRTQLVEKEI